MTDPVWNTLNTIRRTIDRLIADHPAVRSNMAAGAAPRGNVQTDIQGAVEWTTVESAALTRIQLQTGRYQTLNEQALGCLLAAEEISARYATINRDITRAQAEARCDGWDNPTCEDNGVQNVWIDGHCHWLCTRCWDKQRKRKERAS